MSLNFSQTSLLNHGIFLTDLLEHGSRRIHLGTPCVVYVRPIGSNLERLAEELRYPRYSSYYIYFSGDLGDELINYIAKHDKFGLVKVVKRIRGNYLSMHPTHFSLGLDGPLENRFLSWIPSELASCIEGLLSFFHSVRRVPTIRYDALSNMATELARELHTAMSEKLSELEAPGDAKDRGTILLLLDRRSDMLTPLLLPWTYQSILHEVFGIDNGRVDAGKDLHSGRNSRTAQQDFDLRLEDDEFYRDNIDSTFGELGENVKALVATLQQRTLENQDKMSSVPSMKKFLECFPEYKKLSKIVKKHVTLVSELAKRIDKHQLLRISELEQKLIGGDPEVDIQMMEILADGRSRSSLVRLMLIAALSIKRKSTAAMSQIYRELMGSLSHDERALVDVVLKLSSPDSQIDSSFTSWTLYGAGTVPLKNQDMNNVYMRHVPSFIDVVDRLVKGRLPADHYPFVRPSDQCDRPQEMVIFFINGSTYEEAHYLRKYGELIPGVSFTLGGTSVLNTTSFLQFLRHLREILGARGQTFHSNK